MSTPFAGVWTALVTPFDANLDVDLKGFRELIRRQVHAGVTGIIPCGTTGESPTLSLDEKKLLITTALKETRGTACRVIAGTGGNDTRTTVSLSKWAASQGVSGLLVVTPYYNKPTQPGLESHFRAVADAVSCPIMLYNVPGRTGVSLTAKTVVDLAKHPNIRAIKEASGNLPFTSEILNLVQKLRLAFEILSGDDALFLPSLSVGGSGIVSVASNLLPSEWMMIFRAYGASDTQKAARLHQKYYPLMRDLFIESNPGPIKWALERQSLCSARMRPPLAPLASDSIKTLDATLTECEVKRA